MKPLKNRYSLTLDEDVAEKIKEMAENDDRSFSQYINIILKDWIKSQESGRNEQIKQKYRSWRYFFRVYGIDIFVNIISKLGATPEQGCGEYQQPSPAATPSQKHLKGAENLAHL